jgi:hypothetical protein
MPGTDRFDQNSAAHFQVLSNELGTVNYKRARQNQFPAISFISQFDAGLRPPMPGENAFAAVHFGF